MVKPHIRINQCMGMWECVRDGTRGGYGLTPQRAYVAWVVRND